MSLMLNNKSDFVLEYNENCGGTLKRDDVDWTQFKVIFMSPQFTEYQKQSINFKDVPFEPWEIKRYENNLIGFIQHKTTSEQSISSISNDKVNIVNEVSREVTIYNEDDYIKGKNLSDIVKDLYYSLRTRITNIGEVQVVSRQNYIGFKRKTNFVDIGFQKNNLLLWINLKKGEIDDPKGIARDISGIGGFGNGDYDMRVNPDTDLDYVMFLINQSYKKQDI